MANLRRLSLDGEQRRHSFRKQVSEEKPRTVKIAWAEESPKGEGVIAKKCIKEVKKPVKLIRHNSLEKDSILYSKPEFRQMFKEREKTNLDIFLGRNIEDDFESAEPPKITPLLTPLDNVFHIRKSRESARTAVVVVPTAEKAALEDVTPPASDRSFDKHKQIDSKAIKDVIIRPTTAATKRERFQKRTNTAFTSAIKEGRPPLVRSASAPTKPEAKPKFLATKRKIRSGKVRVKVETSEDEDNSNKENPKTQKEMNRYVAINGTDIVTMVSLVSPTASDTEEPEVDLKPKASACKPTLAKKEEKDVSATKNLSLRKTVSFQSSSIHAIRSFSASFPSRRGSMATALLGKSQKSQEKRATAPPEDDEREPKRRLVRSDEKKSCDEEKIEERNIKVDIKDKEDSPVVETKQAEEEEKEEKDENVDDGEPKFGSVKEKECWNMYCKMSEKGLKVSYDTILRGMLTPTEYRMRRRESITTIVEETNTQKVEKE